MKNLCLSLDGYFRKSAVVSVRGDNGGERLNALYFFSLCLSPLLFVYLMTMV